jgi:thiamine-monophosphate kinase
MLSKPAGHPPVRRNGAKVGDAICVTGFLGGALLSKHLNFTPRVKEALEIASLVNLNSMIDISDGLSSDLNRICAQSRVGAIIDAISIPISPDAKMTPDPFSSALNDGEDFELLFTLTENNWSKLQKKCEAKRSPQSFVLRSEAECKTFGENDPLPITRIGTITDTMKMQIKMPDGRITDLKPSGYDHLK